jgi:hypothetical protein
MDSILNSTKKTMGIQPDYSAFDPDILMHINSALAVVVQLGVGAPTVIEDETATWDSLGVTTEDLSMVKNLVYLKTRLGFDPPQTSFSIEAIERQIRELEFRLNVNREEDQWTEPTPEIV